MPSLEDIEAHLSPAHLSASPLSQENVQKNTDLMNAASTCQFDFDSTDLICYRSVLEHVSALNFNQIWLQKTYNTLKSNDQFYHVGLYWTKKELDLVLSTMPYKNVALAIVLQSLSGKVARLTEGYQRMMQIVPSYPRLVMKVYKAFRLPASPLPSLNLQWANANTSAEPKVLYSLLSDLLQRNIIKPDFFRFAKNIFSCSYKAFIKDNGSPPHVAYGFNCELVQPVFMKHTELYKLVSNRWMDFWLLGMRIRRKMPSPTEAALGPSLIESFNMEIKAMDDIEKSDNETRKYALKYSCLHISYLISCMHFALEFDLLSNQEHSKCVDLLLTHRDLVMNMIEKYSIKNVKN